MASTCACPTSVPRVSRTATSRCATCANLCVKNIAGGDALTSHASACLPVSPPPFMAGIAEVEVDKATGKVTVVNYAAAVDCGTVINEALARVRAEGGIAQGIGHALYEIVEHDDRGRLRTGNFMSYKLPTRLDIGSIRVAFEPSYEPTGPFGAKSIGEVVINTPLAAVASAVAHATGHGPLAADHAGESAAGGVAGQRASRNGRGGATRSAFRTRGEVVSL